MAEIISNLQTVGSLAVSVSITISGMTAGQKYTLYRQAPNEGSFPVRGGYQKIATSSATVVIDTSPPLGRPVTYVLYINDSYRDSKNITVAYNGHHIITDVVSGVSVECDVEYNEDERTNASRASILQPVGSRFPIAVYDTRTADTGTLTLLCDSRPVSEDMANLLVSGRPLASRHRYDGCDIDSVEYLYFADASRSRWLRSGARRFTLPFSVVQVPDLRGDTIFNTLQDVANYYGPNGTLQSISDDPRFNTLLALAEHDFGGV